MSLFAYFYSRIGKYIGERGEANAIALTKGVRPLRRAIYIGGVAFCTGALFRHYVISWSLATGNSMYPTMPATAHPIITDRTKGKGKGIKIGDFIHFESPIFREQFAGKRVIGMPGDYVVRDPYMASSVGGAEVPGITDWRSEKGIADGVELKEKNEPEMIRVPEGHVWVTGDNMSWSRDSRFYGAVPMALIRGKTFMTGENVFQWSWVDTQMNRIPKEQEEEYLKHRSYTRTTADKVADMVADMKVAKVED